MVRFVIIQTDERKYVTPRPPNEDTNWIWGKPLLLKPQPLYVAFGTDATGSQTAYRELFRDAPEQVGNKKTSRRWLVFNVLRVTVYKMPSFAGAQTFTSASLQATPSGGERVLASQAVAEDRPAMRKTIHPSLLPYQFAVLPLVGYLVTTWPIRAKSSYSLSHSASRFDSFFPPCACEYLSCSL